MASRRPRDAAECGREPEDAKCIRQLITGTALRHTDVLTTYGDCTYSPYIIKR